MDNIFMADRKPIQFEEYLKYDENSRGNLGEELPVLVYRLLEYSLKEELIRLSTTRPARLSPFLTITTVRFSGSSCFSSISST